MHNAVCMLQLLHVAIAHLTLPDVQSSKGH
jgi:hypothetical protein